MSFHPAGICLFKANNVNTRRTKEICSKLTIKTPERRSGAVIDNFEQIVVKQMLPGQLELEIFYNFNDNVQSIQKILFLRISKL